MIEHTINDPIDSKEIITEDISNWISYFKNILNIIYCSDDTINIRKDIQILRALSVIIIFFYHLNIHKWVFGSGFIGVDIFFVISGYLVVGTLLKEERNEKFSILLFFSRRIKRLFIPNIICLCIIFIFTFIFDMGIKVYNDLNAASLHYINYYFIVGENDYFKSDSSESYVLHYWSLAVEEQFYFVLPIIFGLYKICLCRIFQLKEIWNNVWIYISLIFILSLLSIAIISNSNIKFFSMITRIWEFLAGAIIFEIEHSILNEKIKRKPYYDIISLILQIIIVICFIVLSFILPSPINLPWPNAFTMVVIFLSSLFILCKPSIQFKPVELIGDWSYSIYLYHYPIIKIVQNGLNHINIGITSLIIFIITILISLFSYYCIEKVHRINKWEPLRWITLYITISIFLSFIFLYMDSTQQLKIYNKANINININTSLLFFDPYNEKYNKSLFEKSIKPCENYYANHDKNFWGPGYSRSDYSDLVIEKHGREEFCVILVGNSRTRHFNPLVNLFVNITNSTLYDGCGHTQIRRYSNISKKCKNIITFIGADPFEYDDLNYFPTIGLTIKFIDSPRWWYYYSNRNKDVLSCIEKNYSNITKCSIPMTVSYLLIANYSRYCYRKNLYMIDFTEDICSNDYCHLNIGNELLTIDAWHYCPSAILKLWPKFLSYLNTFEGVRKFILK